MVETQVKVQQTERWNQVAAGWATSSEWTDRNFHPLTMWLQTAADWRPGARVLDVGCGPGYPSLAAAAAVRPGGIVTAIDISTEMIAEASRRASALGLGNVRFVEMDAERLQFDPNSFDAVMNVYGLMFCPDPERAIAEAYRVMNTGGHIVVITWGEPATNPFFTTIGEIARQFLSLPPVDPLAPGPFRFAASGELERVLQAGGFSDHIVDSLAMTFECASVAE